MTPRSPIEQMVDQACGFDPKERALAVGHERLDVGSTALLATADAATAWWKSRWPDGWNVDRHLASPCVNCDSEEDKALALAAAAVVRLDVEWRGRER